MLKDREQRLAFGDFVVFLIKLLIDGAKDYALFFISIGAFVMDTAFKRQGSDRFFYSVMDLGERFDRRLESNLWRGAKLEQPLEKNMRFHRQQFRHILSLTSFHRFIGLADRRGRIGIQNPDRENAAVGLGAFQLFVGQPYCHHPSPSTGYKKNGGAG